MILLSQVRRARARPRKGRDRATDKSPRLVQTSCLSESTDKKLVKNAQGPINQFGLATVITRGRFPVCISGLSRMIAGV
jgi:hypothetical protein